MELKRQKVHVMFILGWSSFFGMLQLSLGLGLSEVTTRHLDNPTKVHLQNITLHHLSLAYLEPYSNVSTLRIFNSKLGKVDETAFDQMVHLNLLEISDSEIREQIDRQTFSGLPGLEILILRNVGLRAADLNLTHVQDLTLTHNEMEKFDGRAVIGRELNVLDISSNKLRTLEGSFANMSKLRTIDISRNELEKLPPVFEKNLNLRNVLASENQLKSTEGLRLPWLRRLNLFGNKIEFLSSKSFPNMKSLEVLILAFNNIKHLDEDAFKDLEELKHLDLAWNEIEELKSDLFRRNLYLTKLYLQGNKIKTLQKFQTVHPHLIHLDLSHNELTTLDSDFFRSTPSLADLNLGFNRLKTLDAILSPLENLKILNLAYNSLAMTGTELSANVQLKFVNLSSNVLQGGLSHFVHNPLLTLLDLSYNKISHFCDGSAVSKNLLKLNLNGNEIQSLSCLKEMKSVCEVDIRNNPLVCGKEFEDLILDLATRKGSPYKLVQEFQQDVLPDQCEVLSLNQSFNLWNSVKLKLCPEAHREMRIEEKTEESGSTQVEEVETFDKQTGDENVAVPQKKHYVVLPIGWIRHDEMNKPNPLEAPQSGRVSWGNIEENSELKGFEDEEVEKRPSFSWYTIALILIGLSITLTFFNLAVFLYIRLKVWKKSESASSQKYIFLHNEVYKNTTEPTKVVPGEVEWTVENESKNKTFPGVGKINQMLFNLALSKRDKDSESAKNVLIGPSNNSQNC